MNNQEHPLITVYRAIHDITAKNQFVTYLNRFEKNNLEDDDFLSLKKSVSKLKKLLEWKKRQITDIVEKADFGRIKEFLTEIKNDNRTMVIIKKAIVNEILAKLGTMIPSEKLKTDKTYKSFQNYYNEIKWELSNEKRMVNFVLKNLQKQEGTSNRKEELAKMAPEILSKIPKGHLKESAQLILDNWGSLYSFLHKKELEKKEAAGQRDTPGRDMEVSGESAGLTGAMEVPGETAAFAGEMEVPGETAAFAGEMEAPGETAAFAGEMEAPGETAGFAGEMEVPGETAGIAGDMKAPGESAGIVGDMEVSGGILPENKDAGFSLEGSLDLPDFDEADDLFIDKLAEVDKADNIVSEILKEPPPRQERIVEKLSFDPRFDETYEEIADKVSNIGELLGDISRQVKKLEKENGFSASEDFLKDLINRVSEEKGPESPAVKKIKNVLSNLEYTHKNSSGKLSRLKNALKDKPVADQIRILQETARDNKYKGIFGAVRNLERVALEQNFDEIFGNLPIETQKVVAEGFMQDMAELKQYYPQLFKKLKAKMAEIDTKLKEAYDASMVDYGAIDDIMDFVGKAPDSLFTGAATEEDELSKEKWRARAGAGFGEEYPGMAASMSEEGEVPSGAFALSSGSEDDLSKGKWKDREGAGEEGEYPGMEASMSEEGEVPSGAFAVSSGSEDDLSKGKWKDREGAGEEGEYPGMAASVSEEGEVPSGAFALSPGGEDDLSKGKWKGREGAGEEGEYPGMAASMSEEGEVPSGGFAIAPEGEEGDLSTGAWKNREVSDADKEALIDDLRSVVSQIMGGEAEKDSFLSIGKILTGDKYNSPETVMDSLKQYSAAAKAEEAPKTSIQEVVRLMRKIEDLRDIDEKINTVRFWIDNNYYSNKPHIIDFLHGQLEALEGKKAMEGGLVRRIFDELRSIEGDMEKLKFLNSRLIDPEYIHLRPLISNLIGNIQGNVQMEPETVSKELIAAELESLDNNEKLNWLKIRKEIPVFKEYKHFIDKTIKEVSGEETRGTYEKLEDNMAGLKAKVSINAKKKKGIEVTVHDNVFSLLKELQNFPGKVQKQKFIKEQEVLHPLAEDDTFFRQRKLLYYLATGNNKNKPALTLKALADKVLLSLDDKIAYFKLLKLSEVNTDEGIRTLPGELGLSDNDIAHYTVYLLGASKKTLLNKLKFYRNLKNGAVELPEIKYAYPGGEEIATSYRDFFKIENAHIDNFIKSLEKRLKIEEKEEKEQVEAEAEIAEDEASVTAAAGADGAEREQESAPAMEEGEMVSEPGEPAERRRPEDNESSRKGGNIPEKESPSGKAASEDVGKTGRKPREEEGAEREVQEKQGEKKKEKEKEKDSSGKEAKEKEAKEKEAKEKPEETKSEKEKEPSGKEAKKADAIDKEVLDKEYMKKKSTIDKSVKEKMQEAGKEKAVETAGKVKKETTDIVKENKNEPANKITSMIRQLAACKTEIIPDIIANTMLPLLLELEDFETRDLLTTINQNIFDPVLYAGTTPNLDEAIKTIESFLNKEGILKESRKDLETIIDKMIKIRKDYVTSEVTDSIKRDSAISSAVKGGNIEKILGNLKQKDPPILIVAELEDTYIKNIENNPQNKELLFKLNLIKDIIRTDQEVSWGDSNGLFDEALKKKVLKVKEIYKAAANIEKQKLESKYGSEAAQIPPALGNVLLKNAEFADPHKILKDMAQNDKELNRKYGGANKDQRAVIIDSLYDGRKIFTYDNRFFIGCGMVYKYVNDPDNIGYPKNVLAKELLAFLEGIPSNQEKVKFLGVPKDKLEEFNATLEKWAKKAKDGETISSVRNEAKKKKDARKQAEAQRAAKEVGSGKKGTAKSGGAGKKGQPQKQKKPGGLAALFGGGKSKPQKKAPPKKAPPKKAPPKKAPPKKAPAKKPVKNATLMKQLNKMVTDKILFLIKEYSDKSMLQMLYKSYIKPGANNPLLFKLLDADKNPSLYASLKEDKSLHSKLSFDKNTIQKAYEKKLKKVK